MKMLTVDDSAAIRHMIRNTVEMLGYDCLEAGNGAEALTVLEKNAQDIGMVLLDWNMPVMDGLATLKAIKANNLLPSIPIIMVTTEMERQKIIEAVKEGATSYLVKPFTSEELASKVLQTLGIT